MASRTPKQPAKDKVEVEPGFKKRLGDMYKKVLHTPSKHVPDKRTRPKSDANSQKS